jgi:hypothetical protein
MIFYMKWVRKWGTHMALVIFGFDKSYRVFHRFRQGKFAYGGSILSLSQFLLLSRVPQDMEVALKVVKIDSKIVISLP